MFKEYWTGTGPARAGARRKERARQTEAKRAERMDVTERLKDEVNIF